MALKELKKEMRHCAVSPLIFLWREYLSYKVFPERKLGQQPCDEVAQCEGTEGQRQDEPRCAQFHGLQYVEKDGVEHDDVQQVNAITQARQPVDETVARGFLPGMALHIMKTPKVISMTLGEQYSHVSSTSCTSSWENER